jgi:thiol-disulfide isomerase/thioredoxin
MNRITCFFCMLFFMWLTVSIHAFSGRYESLAPQDMPEFTFMNPEGFPVTLDQYKGKVIVLNFWSITCGPCIAEMPSLDQLAGYYPEEDLMVITVNVDPLRKPGIQSFYDENRYRYLKIYQDPTRASQQVLKWQGLPTTFIINKEGKLIGREVGYEKWDSADALALFDQLIEGKNPKIQPSLLQKMKGWVGF